jgi:UDP-glucose 4-epimerase
LKGIKPNPMNRILVTGGLGYIGSHTCVALIEAGYHPVVIDSLRNTRISVKQAIEEITGKSLEFYQLDAKDAIAVSASIGNIDGVIHFAALKSVGESIEKPMEYYTENLESLLSIIQVANEKKAKSFIFSSSATVYGDTEQSCVTEETPLGKPLNPYGHTKILGEKILQSGIQEFKTILLRYFNPVGAHESAMIGELPNGIPNNLVPYITQTAAGKREKLTVFGNDYNTKDGTCIRDFIHVVDLAEAHIAALNYSEKMNDTLDIFNVGTGQGNTILELIDTFEKVNKLKLNYSIGDRRPGDIEAIYTDTSKIESKIGWKAKKGLSMSMKDSWKWEEALSTR